MGELKRKVQSMMLGELVNEKQQSGSGDAIITWDAIVSGNTMGELGS